MPKARPKSLVVSVFPVPAGPAGAPPIIRCKDLRQMQMAVTELELENRKFMFYLYF